VKPATSVVLAVLATAALVVGIAIVRAVIWPAAGITINGDGTGRPYDGVGAVLGGGGNARYLMDYPEPQRSQILDYLFTPGVGASLQLLKLEIGGDANSSDGAEPSVEHARGRLNCQSGYEFAIAAQAVARNPALRLYGLQWAAPGWVGDRQHGLFTGDDISYLLDWLGCAGRHGLRISYLGGWNESDNGEHAGWFHALRQALDAHGYREVRIVAGDGAWHYADSPDVAILGTHDPCGFPTGVQGAATSCEITEAALASGKPLWGSEMGGMDAGAQAGCHEPCAPAMARAMIRGYLDARMTGYLEWPVLDAMPAKLPFENRGLITADQPWSGYYTVNAMTWVVAHLTQFARPGWEYVDPSSGYLDGNRADGSYVTLVSNARDEFSTIIETTAATSARRVTFRVNGGRDLSGRTVHVWASDLRPGNTNPATWFVRRPDIHAVHGSFSLAVEPGWVYSLTTTTGQGTRGSHPAAVPPATPLPLPYHDDLTTSGAGPDDDEPGLLAAQDGAFEIAPCAKPHGSATTCTVQQAEPVPVLWHGSSGGARYPFAIVGDGGWSDYTVSVDVLLTRPHTSAGLIGRFDRHGSQADIGHFGGYVFDLSTTGGWRLVRNDVTASGVAVLASGTLTAAAGVDRWHHLTLSLTGTTITATVDGRAVATVNDTTWRGGLAGIEAGLFTGTWPHAGYANLTVTP
jgi:Glycosyl hydrolase family 59/Galactocerebrosidase, C-terminal lectin domain